MFKALRIGILLLILFFVAASTWLTQSRSTDWNNSLWVKIYPINADGSDESRRYIAGLKLENFSGIEEFVARELPKYGRHISQPVRMELGREISSQPPSVGDPGQAPSVMWWSLKLRWWANSVTDDQDDVDPDVRIFVRYHSPQAEFVLENSVGLQKVMVGIVNAYASRSQNGTNNVVIAHEFLHTLGASDKYDSTSGQPHFPHGVAEPDLNPRYPQRYAEIMGGRIAISEFEAMVPTSLKYAIIGDRTAAEIKLL